MPFLLRCANPRCEGQAVVPDCACPPDPSGAHLAHCAMGDVDAAVNCPDPKASGCCGKNHHHARVAQAEHTDHAGPHGADRDDCSVCRPVIITPLPGTVQVSMAVPGSQN